jgi:hypothetical protein
MCSISPKTRSQIAEEYGFSYSTLMRKLKKYGITIPSGNLLLTTQKKIYELLGYPPDVNRDNCGKIINK